MESLTITEDQIVAMRTDRDLCDSTELDFWDVKKEDSRHEHAGQAGSAQ
jgi:hypothetical protein